MNKFIITASLCLAASVANAETKMVGVQDYYATQVISEPYAVKECYTVEVPIYGQRQGGDAGAGALGGMILGGILGKGLTGDDGGAAAGAVLGGIIGANEAQNNTRRVVTGYKQERKCDQVTRYRDKTRRVYDYSVVTFKQNGRTYELQFIDATK